MSKLKDILKIVSLGLAIISTVRSLSPSPKSATTSSPLNPTTVKNDSIKRAANPQEPQPLRTQRKISRKIAKQPHQLSAPTNQNSSRESDQVIIDKVRLGLKNGDYTK